MSYVFSKPPECDLFPFIGGGGSYDPNGFSGNTNHPCGDRVTKNDADVVVTQVEDIPSSPSSGTTIWFEGSTTLDLGGRNYEYNSDNVTLASDRGVDGSEGALIRSTQRTKRVFELNGDNSRVTSLRLEGPEPESFDDEGYPASEGISVNGAYVEIDNCVIRGFTHAAIEVGKGSYPNWLHIHHCDLVDNHSKDLGYGVTVFHGHPRIRACYFDNNRHSVAGDGAADCGWTTIDCIGGEHHRLHAWDMHGDGNGNAGKYVDLRNNILLSTHNWYGTSGPSDYGQETLSIRGIPREQCTIKYNAFSNTKPTEPMRDHDNDAFNVQQTTTFSEGKIGGVDSNVYEWSSGSSLPDGIGPTRETSVTGYDGTSGGDSGSDSGSEDSGSNMSNPTSDKTGSYEVTVHGNGSTQSAYLLVGTNGLAEVNDSLESNDSLVGRAVLGYVSTLSDTFTVSGPVDEFKHVGGDTGLELEVDGQRYSPSAFDGSGSSSGDSGASPPYDIDMSYSVDSDGNATLSVNGVTEK